MIIDRQVGGDINVSIQWQNLSEFKPIPFFEMIWAHNTWNFDEESWYVVQNDG